MSSPQEKNDTAVILDGEVLPPAVPAEAAPTPEIEDTTPETARAFLDGGGTGTEPATLPAHRPSGFTQEIADHIIDSIATTRYSVGDLLKEPGMPSFSTIQRWRAKYPEFGEAYNAALRFRAECLAYDTLEKADNLQIGVKQKEKILDFRKWLMAKLIPTIFADAPTTVINADIAIGAPSMPGGDAAKPIEGTHVLSLDPFASAIAAWEKVTGNAPKPAPAAAAG